MQSAVRATNNYISLRLLTNFRDGANYFVLSVLNRRALLGSSLQIDLRREKS